MNSRLCIPVASLWLLSQSFLYSGSSQGTMETLSEETIRFQADWFSNGQFSGFFWADQAGLYHQEGIALEFLPFDYGVDFIDRVGSGEAAFGTAEAHILMDAVARGEPIVALGAVLGTSPAGYIYLEKTGIESAEDLAGKSVGVHNYAEALLPFFVAKAGLPEASVTAVEVKHHVEILLDGEVDLHQGYAIDEMIRLQKMTEEPVNILLFEELGLTMYSMVIYSSKAFVEANPELVTRFMRASAVGWEAAVAAPKIAQLVVNGPFADERVDDSIIEEQIKSLAPFVVQAGRPTLSMSVEKWEAMQRAYLDSGMIETEVDLNSFLYHSWR
ncbi:MAG: ABC transporter substrate-binding protein [Verrucomicrobia bacterium]|jgi:ABC-type nitrate/sulfonate/bicarbonate transport system substrate-binding protein|nr:ABC transporter substrate-binding protein [Verrucomicrobiota bacterium]